MTPGRLSGRNAPRFAARQQGGEHSREIAVPERLGEIRNAVCDAVDIGMTRYDQQFLLWQKRAKTTRPRRGLLRAKAVRQPSRFTETSRT